MNFKKYFIHSLATCSIVLLSCQASIVDMPQSPDSPKETNVAKSTTKKTEPLNFDAKTLLTEDLTITPPTPDEYQQLKQSELTDKYNAFGLKLFKRIVAKDPHQNVSISPLSLMMALSLLYNAAAGETREEIARVLEVTDLELQEYNALTNILWRALSFESEELKVQLANSLWGHLSQDFSDTYLNNLQNYYQARLTRLNFLDLDASAKRINDWISERTQGLINNILSPASLVDAKFVLVNTLYFNGQWISPFSITNTYEETFQGTLSNTEVNMMHNPESSGSYFQTAEAEYLLSQFKTLDNESETTERSAFEMLFILPAPEKTVEDILEPLNIDGLSAIDKQLPAIKSGSIIAPRFSEGYTNAEISDHLRGLGFENTFSSAANFSNMGTNSQVDAPEVLHSTQVNMYERGVEAAATTIIIGRLPNTDVYPSFFRFEADRPFIYLIRHRETGLILFCGTIKNLEKQDIK